MNLETMRQEGLRESLARTVYGIVAYDAGHAASVEEGRSLWDQADWQTKVVYRITVAPFVQKAAGADQEHLQPGRHDASPTTKEKS